MPRGRVHRHVVIEDVKRLRMAALADPADDDSTVLAIQFEAASVE